MSTFTEFMVANTPPAMIGVSGEASLIASAMLLASGYEVVDRNEMATTSGDSSATRSAIRGFFMSGWQVSNITTSWPRWRTTGASTSMPIGGNAITLMRSAPGSQPPSSRGRRL